MSSTIAVVGAGSGLGQAIAHRFGAEGRSVALIARTESRLKEIAASLKGAGITVGVYPADVTDEPGLVAALAHAADELGRISVLTYSPGAVFDFADGQMPDLADLGFTSALATTVESARAQFELLVCGALTATHAVLPAMRDAGDGTLLFTTGTTSIVPLPFMGNNGIAQAGLRNWATNMHETLAPEGIYVGHLSIGVPIVPNSGDGDPANIAGRLFELAKARDSFESRIGF